VLKAEEEGIKEKGRLLSLPKHRLSKNAYSEKKIRSVVHKMSQKTLSV